MRLPFVVAGQARTRLLALALFAEQVGPIAKAAARAGLAGQARTRPVVRCEQAEGLRLIAAGPADGYRRAKQQ